MNPTLPQLTDPEQQEAAFRVDLLGLQPAFGELPTRALPHQLAFWACTLQFVLTLP